MAKDAEAYNKKHGKQEGEKCETEMADEGMIHLPNEKYGKKGLRCGSPWIAHQVC